MPYIVLARKWRPQNFQNVIGQDHVTKTLQNAISHGRIAHAYLFSGPRGTGKTTVARIFAKAVNCMEGIKTEPCEKCKTCMEIANGRSIDVIEIDAASNRGIDEIRELRESVKFSPVSGRYKVYIIDEAHMLTLEAFNALLKTLEEPPGHVIFILATTEPHKIPATILSRCQRFDFRRLTRNEIIQRLKELSILDKFSIDDESLSLIAESADGGMRDAESILDQLLSFSEGNIQPEKASEILGLGHYHLLDQLAENILKNDSPGSLNTLNILANQGADINQCLKRLISYFRDLMVYKINQSLIDASDTQKQKLAKHSQMASVEKIMKIARLLAQTESDIKQLGYERLNLELALVKLSRLREDDIPVDKLLGKLEEMESKLAAVVIVTSEADSQKEQEYKEVASTEIIEETPEIFESDPVRSTWFKLMDSIRQRQLPGLHAILKDANPVSISDEAMIIDFGPSYKWHREQVQEVNNKNIIESELAKIMGKPLKIKLANSNAEENSSLPKSSMEIKKEIKEDENVKLVLDIFEGRIVDIKQ